MTITTSYSPSDFDYTLPPERIAQYPLADRASSRLLHYTQGEINHHNFRELPSLLPQNSMLVFNDTRVIPARTFFKKPTGAVIQIFLLEPVGMDIQQAMTAKHALQWTCIIGQLKKWKNDEVITTQFDSGNRKYEVRARLIDRSKRIVELDWDGDLLFSEVLRDLGRMPLPPYIKRDSDDLDADRYQTVYARYEGAVAAPTAGLHFTEEVIAELDKRPVERAFLTLHVGAGTFQPLQAENVLEHDMHAEHFEVPLDTLRRIRANENRFAVGTTSLRTLESLYWAGVKISRNEAPAHIEKLYAYNHPSEITYEKSLDHLIHWLEEKNENNFKGSTSIMIMPGYRIRSIRGLVTNFHLPQSTLIMLVAALIGDNWRTVYAEALANEYRFLSYGDSSLLMV